MDTNHECYDILVVDDSTTSRRYLQATLEDEGYHVRVCGDASEACWEIDSNPPDFILAEWELPNMDGADLCRWVRDRQIPTCIYVILMTGHKRVLENVDKFDDGADDHVQKPIKFTELLSRIRCGERILKLERRLRLLEARQPALTQDDQA